jgi:uncharacterized protein (DUF4415 family)
MSDDTSGTISKTKPTTDWRRVRAMADDEIRAGIVDDPDARPTDEAFWKDARVAMPRRKETVTIRLDADLLDWFRSEGGYQTRINAILRAYMNAHADDRSSVTMMETRTLPRYSWSLARARKRVVCVKFSNLAGVGDVGRGRRGAPV